MSTTRIKDNLFIPSPKVKNGSQGLFSHVTPRFKNRHIIFFLIAITLVLLWYGPYLISDRLGIFDTKKDIFFFAYLGQSLRTLTYPFFFVAPPPSVAWYPTLGISHAAFANPEVYSFSPDMIFMPFLSPVHFAKLHFGLHFLAGIFGIYLLSDRLKLRLEYGLGLLLLILLNPWYLQHLAIGFFPWINAALFPLIVALLIPKATGKYNLCFAGLINSLIVYQGGIHLFLWFNAATLLVSVVLCLKHRTIGPLVRVFGCYVVTFFAALPKLVLGVSVYKGMAQEILTSCGSLRGLWDIFTDHTINLYKIPEAYNIHNVNWYDGSLYMGIFFIVLVLISIILACINQKWKILINELLIPGIILTVVSWGDNWSRIVAFFDSATEMILGRPIYVLHAEKYPWRFLFITVLLFSAFAMVQLSDFVSRIRKPGLRISVTCVFCLLLLLVARDLWARNHYFSRVATSTTLEDGKGWDIKAHMRTVPVLNSSFQPVLGAWVDGSIGPNRIQIPARLFSQNDIVILPWLKSNDASLFKIDNCEIRQLKPQALVAVKILDRKKDVVLTYKEDAFFTTLIIGVIGVIISFAMLHRGLLKKWQ